MRPFNRALSTAVAATVATVVVGAIPASAQTSAPNGVGSTTTTTSVLNLSLGSAGNLLKLGILTDKGVSSIDSHSAPAGASNDLVPLTIDSNVAGLHLAVPGLHTAAPAGPTNAGGTALTLGTLGVPASLATASINPAALHSDYSTTAAHSTIGAAQIQNLTIAGGALASIDILASNLNADALSTSADGARGVQVGTIKLLDLGALLKGLGVDLTQLPLSTVTGLIDQLGLAAGLPAGTSLTQEVANIQTAITGLQSALTSATGNSTLPTALSSTTTTALQTIGSLPAPLGAAKAAAVTPISIPTAGTPLTAVTGLLGQLQSSLGSLLSASVPALDSFPLVQLNGTTVGITTKAADTVANSAAGVTLQPLTLKVAGTPLTIDAAATINQVNTTLATANGALNGLLTQLGLPTNLVSLSLLDQAHNVAMNGAYTVASAGLSLATLKVAAIDPAKIVSGITALGGTPLASVLPSLGLAAGSPLASVLSATNAMGALNAALGQVAPLTGGAQLQIASLNSASTYTVAPTAAPTGTPITPAHTSLPHTGGNPALAIIGVILALLAFGGVRWVRSARSAMTNG